ncbi:hypothetical protein [Streptomyces sp. NPDC055134]
MGPDYRRETVYEDVAHIAFLDRWPTLPGRVLGSHVRAEVHLREAVGRNLL